MDTVCSDLRVRPQENVAVWECQRDELDSGMDVRRRRAIVLRTSGLCK